MGEGVGRMSMYNRIESQCFPQRMSALCGQECLQVAGLGRWRGEVLLEQVAGVGGRREQVLLERAAVLGGMREWILLRQAAGLEGEREEILV